MTKKIAVILCGSGFKDGSEIRESVGTLYALEKHGFDYQCFAPDENQYHVVNCNTGTELPNQFRNQLIESARITRGNVEDIKKLKAEDFDAIILPGGFGAAKNLCNYAIRGIDASVQPEVARVLNEFYNGKKPIGAICISPMILALNFKKKDFKITLGKESDTSIDAEKLGHTMYYLEANQAFTDRENLIVTTPAYMDDKASLVSVFEGIDSLVVEIKKLLK
jgi:enhancing lycopene biosynthesis protein 2